jgi:hypothetical protein
MLDADFSNQFLDALDMATSTLHLRPTGTVKPIPTVVRMSAPPPYPGKDGFH